MFKIKCSLITKFIIDCSEVIKTYIISNFSHTSNSVKTLNHWYTELELIRTKKIIRTNDLQVHSLNYSIWRIKIFPKVLSIFSLLSNTLLISKCIILVTKIWLSLTQVNSIVYK